MPINPHACPGPCNRAYRDAVDAYDRAFIAHCLAIAAYQEAVDAYPGVVAAWHAPLLYPAPPARPAPLALPTIRPYLANPVWDSRCTRYIRQALAELDDLASVAQAQVDGHRDAGARYGKTGAVSKVHASSPSPVTDTLDELYGALVEVEDQWREYRGYQDRPRRARGSHARRLTIAWLLDELDAILLHPGSIAFGTATLAWQRRLRGLTKSDPLARRSPIRCSRCSERQISRRDDGYYQCGSCEKLMTQTEHDREYSEQADQIHEQEAHAS
ncbi:hypothetical protein SAMN05216275_14149 [Streptosporangium canum]|uniref:Uncharacterized protein n=1 Tax=Streptosporangium canum TaxID=324952 RepID=A0A1I4DFC3_9ACTN|nr:hypothetical protein [Streptosporangium canum]SFK92338.1 hypothetical protein SAMN05216275_14149 [Streptosporangium canum]